MKKVLSTVCDVPSIEMGLWCYETNLDPRRLAVAPRFFQMLRWFSYKALDTCVMQIVPVVQSRSVCTRCETTTHRPQRIKKWSAVAPALGGKLISLPSVDKVEAVNSCLRLCPLAIEKLS